MGRTGILNFDKSYDPIRDMWTDSAGKTYIKNELDQKCPIWIDISSSKWNLHYSGNIISIDWNTLVLPPGMLIPIMAIVKDKLKKLNVSYINSISCCLNMFQQFLEPSWSDFADISANEMIEIWKKLVPKYRSILRSLYEEMAMRRIGGARADLAYEMRRWKARHKVVPLRGVLEWDPTKGALTSSEEEVLRQTLRKAPQNKNESAREHGIRIYGWLLLDTLKRSSQILQISNDALKCVPNNGRDEWFVEILPFKYQTGDPYRWWHISEELANDIIAYSKRPKVSFQQNKFNRLIVWDAPALFYRGVLSAADGKVALNKYIISRGAISPRTGKVLHVTPLRIRHTGATRLAFAGVSRDLIQEILEHDSPESCQSYIDAIGSEIVPQIEKAGRVMGNVFFQLNKTFFQGKVVPETSGMPILVPGDCTRPLIVGSCGRDPIKHGVCKKHPFLSCYAECNSFLAWNTPDPHQKALQYLEAERARWNPSGDSDPVGSIPVRQTLAILDKAIGSAREVLQQIRGDQA